MSICYCSTHVMNFDMKRRKNHLILGLIERLHAGMGDFHNLSVLIAHSAAGMKALKPENNLESFTVN